jgi:ankyrin repeat protein
MYLLARGADINKCTETGHSPITIAHMQGHRNIVKLLHVAGAIVSDRLSAETGFKTKVKDLVLAIGDDTDVRETCANEDCAKVEAAYGDYSACASCKLVYYCSKECQVSAWRSHKKQCKKDAAAMVASKLAE